MLFSHNGCPKCGAKIAAVNEPRFGQEIPYFIDKLVGWQNLQLLRRGEFVSYFLWLLVLIEDRLLGSREC